eukprot:1002450-Pyramimonas_sp.AAC.1
MGRRPCACRGSRRSCRSGPTFDRPLRGHFLVLNGEFLEHHLVAAPIVWVDLPRRPRERPTHGLAARVAARALDA